MTTEYVSHVFDGDTFDTTTALPAVRLDGVDTPERGEPGFESAKRALEALILNKWVGIQTNGNGYYGRRIADVWVGQMHVNQAMKRYSK